MATTLTSILVHITFSTQLRRPIIPDVREPELFGYIGGICKRLASPLLAAGGVADHVHLLVGLHKTLSLANLMLEIKRDSSKVLKSGPHAIPTFAWQEGYFAFSISASAREAVADYIANQKEHHVTLDFRDEVREFLRRHGVPWDEAYIWR